MVAVIPGTISSEEIYRSVDAYLENLNSISGKEFEVSASVGIKSFALTDSADLEYMIRMTDDREVYPAEEVAAQTVSVNELVVRCLYCGSDASEFMLCNETV